jgi:hypothetical protein
MILAAGGQLVRRAAEHDLARVHQRHLGTRRAHVLDQVRGHDDGGALPEVAQQGAELDALLGVQARGRLVEQQQFRVVHDGLRDPDPAQHAARQRTQLGPGLDAEVDPLDRGGHGLRDPGGRHLFQQREVLDELDHGEGRVIAEGLRQVAEPAPDLPAGGLPGRVPVQQPELAGRRRQDRGQHAEQRGLARAVRPEQAEDTGPGGQRDPGHRGVAAERPGQVGQFDVHCRPLCGRVT